MPQNIEKSINKLTGKYQTWEVWADWIYMLAVSLSQPLDFRENREKRFAETARKYTAEEIQIFREITETAISELEQKPEQDLLGHLYMQLNLGNHWTGQFFTPYHLCECMAGMNCDEWVEKIDEKGYVTMLDPACGGGATLIAAFYALKHKLGKEKPQLNVQNHVLIAAQDLSEITALMCYIQLSLSGIAAVVKVGDSLCDPLTGDLLDMPPKDNIWVTPMYGMEPWIGRRLWHKMDIMLRSKPRHKKASELTFEEIFEI